jgi:hypothetical protein
MRTPIIAATLAAMLLPAVPAAAQNGPPPREYRDNRDDRGRDARNDRRDDNRRDWRRYRQYDYNRPEPGRNAYYADDYYRDGRYYQPRRLGSNDRIYAGRDGRYYCRRSDGTTGLIIGGLAGGALGATLGAGSNGVLGALLGAGIGAAIGSSIDRDGNRNNYRGNRDNRGRGTVTCR